MRDYWKQARLSAQTAHEAMRIGDTISALSRAYYAMFDAARAALVVVDPDLIATKKHGTILRRFSKHVVKERGLDPKFANAIRKAYEVRQVAEYDSDPPPGDKTSESLQRMDEFIAAIGAMFPDELN